MKTAPVYAAHIDRFLKNQLKKFVSSLLIVFITSTLVHVLDEDCVLGSHSLSSYGQGTALFLMW